MAAQKDHVICHVCGFKNAPNAERCVSCGAKLEEIQGEYTEEEAARRRAPRRQGFAFHWALIACVVYLAVLGVLLVGLPAAVDAYDPQGLWALVISFVVFFLGGALVGLLSPGKTLWEVGVGAALAIGPTLLWLALTTPEAPDRLGGGFQLSDSVYWISGPATLAFALFGAFLGESFQDRRRR